MNSTHSIIKVENALFQQANHPPTLPRFTCVLQHSARCHRVMCSSLSSLFSSLALGTLGFYVIHAPNRSLWCWCLVMTNQCNKRSNTESILLVAHHTIFNIASSLATVTITIIVVVVHFCMHARVPKQKWKMDILFN